MRSRDLCQLGRMRVCVFSLFTGCIELGRLLGALIIVLVHKMLKCELLSNT